MKTTLQILEESLVLVTDGWTQGEWAKDANGKGLVYDNPKATCFCAEGAILRSGASEDSSIPQEDAQERLKEAIVSTESIADWNDAPERTQEEVIVAFSRAIELEKKLLKNIFMLKEALS
jgi:hypothetical protein